MFGSKNFKLSRQLLVAVTLLFCIQSTARAANNFTPSFKVDSCDCLGFSEDIPTFLSDLSGGNLDIYGEGKTLKAAEEQAQNMCVETYRNFASTSESEHPNNVTRTGCKTMRSTSNGEWVSI